MPVIENLRDNIDNFLNEIRSKNKTIIFSTILIFMMFCAVCILAFKVSTPKKSVKQKEQQKLILEEKLLLPSAPTVNENYIVHRQTNEKWSDDEIKKWWTLIDESELQKLNETNNRIVEDIVGAAP